MISELPHVKLIANKDLCLIQVNARVCGRLANAPCFLASINVLERNLLKA